MDFKCSNALTVRDDGFQKNCPFQWGILVFWESWRNSVVNCGEIELCKCLGLNVKLENDKSKFSQIMTVKWEKRLSICDKREVQSSRQVPQNWSQNCHSDSAWLIATQTSKSIYLSISMQKLKTVLTVPLLSVTEQQAQFLIFANFGSNAVLIKVIKYLYGDTKTHNSAVIYCSDWVYWKNIKVSQSLTIASVFCD